MQEQLPTHSTASSESLVPGAHSTSQPGVLCGFIFQYTGSSHQLFYSVISIFLHSAHTNQRAAEQRTPQRHRNRWVEENVFAQFRVRLEGGIDGNGTRSTTYFFQRQPCRVRVRFRALLSENRCGSCKLHSRTRKNYSHPHPDHYSHS